MSTPASQLPFLPQSLPRTQQEWQQTLNVLQTWARAIQGSASLGVTGYATEAHDVLEQWGLAVVTTGTPLAITFPTPFTQAIWNIQLTLDSPSGAGNTAYSNPPPTQTGFTANVSGAAGISNVYWRAIGQ